MSTPASASIWRRTFNGEVGLDDVRLLVWGGGARFSSVSAAGPGMSAARRWRR